MIVRVMIVCARVSASVRRTDDSCAWVPHPDKADKGGEDACFVLRDQGAFGVMDGVGGWAEEGVDPAAGIQGPLSSIHTRTITRLNSTDVSFTTNKKPRISLGQALS